MFDETRLNPILETPWWIIAWIHHLRLFFFTCSLFASFFRSFSCPPTLSNIYSLLCLLHSPFLSNLCGSLSLSQSLVGTDYLNMFHAKNATRLFAWINTNKYDKWSKERSFSSKRFRSALIQRINWNQIALFQFQRRVHTSRSSIKQINVCLTLKSRAIRFNELNKIRSCSLFHFHS